MRLWRQWCVVVVAVVILASLACGGSGSSSCTAGGACTPANACHLAAISCSSGSAVCADTGASAADGSSCGTAGTCHAGVCSTSGAAYGTTDLTGTWEMNALASGPGAPWWQRGQITVAADGSFSGVLTDNSGAPDAQSAAFALSSTGIVTMSASSSARGCMDADKTIMVLTSTWASGSPGTTDLGVVVKPAQAFSLSQLAGTWEANGLASGPGAPWWERARATIAADGSFTVSTTDSDGGADTFGGTFSVSSGGIVTLTGTSTFRGVVDAGKTIMVTTDTWSTGSPGTTELKVVVKVAGTYGLSDLAGTWEVNGLASGPGAPWWERARITIATDGSFTGTATDSAGGGGSVSGAFSISSSGVVTLGGSSTFRGVLDAGKTIMVATDTWSSGHPGTTELKVFTKVG